MTRKIIRAWDETNGELTVRVYNLYYWLGTTEVTSVKVQTYRSPIRLDHPNDAKHLMSRVGDPLWFGVAAVRELAQVFQII